MARVTEKVISVHIYLPLSGNEFDWNPLTEMFYSDLNAIPTLNMIMIYSTGYKRKYLMFYKIFFGDLILERFFCTPIYI